MNLKLNRQYKLSIHQRILSVLLLCSLLSVLLMGILALKGILDTKQAAVDAGNDIIFQAASNSEAALTERAKLALEKLAVDKAKHVDDYLGKTSRDVQILAREMTEITSHPERYNSRQIAEPDKADAGVFTAQLLFSGAVADKNAPALRQEIGYAANIQDFLLQLNNSSDVIVSSYIASENGFTIMVDRFADRKFQHSDTQPDFYEALSRPWYQLAKAKEKIIFTDIISDALSGEPAIICAAPYYNNGKFAGVVGMGAFLSGINRIMLNTKIGDTGFGFVMNDDGHVILSPHDTGELAANMDAPVDLRQSANNSLAQAAIAMQDGHEGISEVTIDGKAYFLAYAPMQNTDWYFATAIEVDEVIAPAEQSKSAIIAMAQKHAAAIDDELQLTILKMTIAIVLLIAIIIYAGRKLAAYLTEPIRQLSHGVQKITTGNLEGKLNIHTGDEIESLAISFNAMTAELKQYMENLQLITAEKQRIATELNVATSIQQNMLPCIFPPYPERQEFDIYAAMTPAKEVGGDFYDFYLLNENHLVITIADVSDKGIPAAMFMVITKTILKNFAMSMSQPDDFAAVMQCANRQLCENNEEMMFVTVFMGMLNLKSGRFTYVNAGHNPPLLGQRKKGKSEFNYIPAQRNCVLGIDEEIHFSQQELILHAGDELFFYTDGITEAANAENELFSAKRLQKILNERKDGLSCQDTLNYVNKAVANFVQDTAQSDDITMIAVKLNRLVN